MGSAPKLITMDAVDPTALANLTSLRPESDEQHPVPRFGQKH